MMQSDERGAAEVDPLWEAFTTNQTLFVPGRAGVAHIHPQRLLPQCTMGDLHSEDLVQLHDILRGKPACPEQTARGLHAGEHRHTHIPAGKESARKKGEKDRKTNCFWLRKW